MAKGGELICYARTQGVADGDRPVARRGLRHAGRLPDQADLSSQHVTARGRSRYGGTGHRRSPRGDRPQRARWVHGDRRASYLPTAIGGSGAAHSERSIAQASRTHSAFSIGGSVAAPSPPPTVFPRARRCASSCAFRRVVRDVPLLLFVRLRSRCTLHMHAGTDGSTASHANRGAAGQ